MSGAMNRHYSRINYVHSPDGELLLRSVEGIIKTMHTGFSAYACAFLTAGADTEETGRYDLAWKDLCSVLNALSK